MPTSRTLEIVILAAGQGTRMKSPLPKVLHQVCGIPMIEVILEQIEAAIQSKVIPMNVLRFNIVVGHEAEQVKSCVKALCDSGRIQTPVVFTTQERQLGTGHAVKLALENASSAEIIGVFNGDIPLFTTEAFQEFFDAHIQTKSMASLASAIIDNPGHYGRVIRKGKSFVKVVEYKDSTYIERKVKEINGGVYFFDRKILQQVLSKLKNDNASKEFYLTSIFEMAYKSKKRIYAHLFADDSLLDGVNNMKELSKAQKVLYRRSIERLMTEGSFIAEPQHTYVGPRVKIGKNCTIGPFTVIEGDSIIGDRVKIGAHCDLKDTVIGDDSLVRNSTVAEKTIIGNNCAVGPMAHFRPGSKIHDNVRIGNFVEIKESSVGSHTNVAHLSYVGDAQIGSGVNVGCGFITCNYDGTTKNGQRKHRTLIGDNVFIGSDVQVVAPIEIESGTYIASGSTVTESVKQKDSLVIARSRQVTKQGYAKKYRKS